MSLLSCFWPFNFSGVPSMNYFHNMFISVLVWLLLLIFSLFPYQRVYCTLLGPSSYVSVCIDECKLKVLLAEKVVRRRLKKRLKKKIYMKKHVWKTALTIQRQLRGRRDCLVQYFTSSRSKFCTAQPYFNFIAVLFKTLKKRKEKKTQQIITWLKNKLIIWIPRYSTESPRAFWAFGHCDFYVTFLFISLFL